VDLPDLKELRAMLKLCRSQGVTKITLGSVIVEFGDMPMVLKDGQRVIVEDDEGALPAVPSDEDMAFWSAAPDPLSVMESGAQ
jgi:hypothetical protein